MVDIEPLLARADDIGRGVRTLVANARPPRTPPARPRFALFLTIAEQFEVALLLIRTHMASHAATHLRSMTEALVAMSLLERKGNYIGQMQYEKLRGEKKVYEGLLAYPYLDGESRQFVQQRLNVCASDFQALHDSGFRPKRISEDFAEAGLSYLAVPYTVLCGFAHNDLAILALRHQGEQTMTYMAPVEPEVIISIVSVAIQVVMQASQQAGQIALYPEGLFQSTFEDMNIHWAATMNMAAVNGEPLPSDSYRFDRLTD